MRKFFLFGLLLISCSVFSQTTLQYLGGKNTRVITLGVHQIDSGLSIPRDTIRRGTWPDSANYIAEKDNHIYIRRKGGYLGPQWWYNVGPYYPGYGIKLMGVDQWHVDTSGAYAPASKDYVTNALPTAGYGLTGNLAVDTLISIASRLRLQHTIDSLASASMFYADTVNVENIVNFGAVGDGVTDCTAAIQAAIARSAITGKPVYIPKGIFLITGTSSCALAIVTDGQKIFGTGYNSVIKCISQRALQVNANYATVDGIRFDGSLADSTNTGVFLVQRNGIKVTNCFFTNIGGHYDPFTSSPPTNMVRGGGGLVVRGTTSALMGATITNNIFINDSTGLHLALRAEYNTIANNHYISCNVAILNWSGNNSFVNESITGGNYGMIIGNLINPGHSSATNVTANHCLRYGLVIENVDAGMTLVGFMNYSDSVKIVNSKDIKLIGSSFYSAPFLLDSSTNVFASNTIIDSLSSITLAHSAEGLRTLQPPAIKIIPDAAAIAWDARYRTAKVTLGATGRTVTISNAVSGERYNLYVVQDPTGSRTITTWPANTVWLSGSAPTLKTAGSAVDVIEFYYDGSYFYGRSLGQVATGTDTSSLSNRIDAKADKTANINAQTGTTYTLQASDNGKVLTFNNASAITLTVPSGLGAGFNCLVVQIGAGQVTFSASSTTINNRSGYTKTAGQYATATIAAYAANTFVTGGDMQ